MTTSQETHLARIKADFVVLVDAKYRLGAAEHSGDLMQMNAAQILNHAIDEAIDQVVYLLSLKEKLTEEVTV